MDNRIREAFDSVRAEEALKQSTRAYLAARRQTAPGRRRFTGLRRVAVVCAILLLLVLAGGWRLYVTPVSAISVEAAPALELGVNRFDRVVSVKGYNAEGAELARSVRLTHLSYDQALAALFASEAMQAYLAEDDQASITVVAPTDAESEAMCAAIAACGYAEQPNVQCHCGDKEQQAAAQAAGLSYGRYQAFLELQALDPQVTAEQAQELSLRQLRERVCQLSGADDTGHQGQGGGDHDSNGYQGGQGGGYDDHDGGQSSGSQGGGSQSGGQSSGSQGDGDHDGGGSQYRGGH